MGDGSCESCHPFLSSFANCARTADLALAQKLAEELKYEQEANTGAEEPVLTVFKEHGIWEVREF